MLNSSFSYQSPTFSVSGRLSSPRSRFLMQLHSSPLTTRSYPHTLPLLEKHLPSVLKSQCFNDSRLPFLEEAQNTNFAHLFEHLLLENLCLEQLAAGSSSADFSGRTSWNWATTPRGSYSISLTASPRHSPLFRTAFAKSITLLETILSSPKTEQVTNW